MKFAESPELVYILEYLQVLQYHNGKIKFPCTATLWIWHKVLTSSMSSLLKFLNLSYKKNMIFPKLFLNTCIFESGARPFLKKKDKLMASRFENRQCLHRLLLQVYHFADVFNKRSSDSSFLLFHCRFNYWIKLKDAICSVSSVLHLKGTLIPADHQ